MRLTRFLPAASAWLLPLAGLLAACADPAGPRRGVEAAPVQLSFAIAGTDIQGLSVQVSGPGIQVPIVANVAVPANAASASATIEVPVGAQRTFTARGFDAAGIETHEGMATAAVRGENNPPVVVRMYPKTGSVPVTITPGSYAILIAPAAPSALAIGGTVQLTAAVADADGKAVGGATVQWASLNPMAASVDATGLVTALVQGTTTVVATYKGAAASVEITVNPPPTVFTQVVAGAGFTCALDASGAAWCWGDNSFRTLGNGGTTAQSRPVAVSGGLTFASLTAAGFHACGLTSGGAAFCWGDNYYGQLGDGTTTARSIPTAVGGGHAFSALSAAFFVTCGIGGGAAYCWGWDSNGSLAVGNPVGSTTGVTSPTAVTGGSPFSSISASGFLRCGLSQAGALACWGDKSQASWLSGTGQVTSVFASTAWQAVTVSHGEAFTNSGGLIVPSSGGEFACGVTSAGIAQCWGQNSAGQLGNGSTTASATPVTVSGTQDFGAISAGSDYACGLRAGGSIACWGINDHGQLGAGTSAGSVSSPTTVTGGFTFSQVSAGPDHACGLRTDGAILCWGYNAFGQLGNGNTTSSNVPVLVTP